MTQSKETDWEFFGLWEALIKLMACKQGGSDTPNEFRKSLEERAKVVSALLGNDFLDRFAEGTQGYAALPAGDQAAQNDRLLCRNDQGGDKSPTRSDIPQRHRLPCPMP